MPQTLSTIVVAALTSGTVTLGIEWVFKPRLEARKERLLEHHRKRRTFASQMHTIMVNIAKWSSLDLPSERPDTVTMLLTQDREAAERRIDAAITAMNDDAFDIVTPYATQRIRDLVLRYIFNTRMIQLSDRTRADKWTLLQILTQDTHTWLFGGTWRFWSRGKAMLHLMKTLDDLEVKDITKPSSDDPAAN